MLLVTPGAECEQREEVVLNHTAIPQVEALANCILQKLDNLLEDGLNTLEEIKAELISGVESMKRELDDVLHGNRAHWEEQISFVGEQQARAGRLHRLACSFSSAVENDGTGLEAE